MPNTIILKRRIGSVKNTKQITKAMELVAASKMRRAQAAAQTSRAYREAAHSLLARLGNVADVRRHRLYAERPVKKRLYVTINSNQGLAGAYDANIFRLFTRAAQADHADKIDVDVISIGKKGANFMRGLESVQLIAAYTEIKDHPTANDIRPILNTIVDLFRRGEVDSVQVLYTTFKSNLVQEAMQLQLLPARFEEVGTGKTAELSEVTFEPSLEAVLNNTTVRLLEVQLWQALLESIASQYSMQMLAMKNATDNASDLIGDLTLAFNTARQAAITQEIAEITGGAEAMA